MTEEELANVLVSVVCNCGPRWSSQEHFHERGFPECSTARAAARAVLRHIERTDEVSARSDPKPGRKNLPTAEEMERARYVECPTCGTNQGWFTQPYGPTVACPICRPRSRFIVSPVPDNPPDAYQGAF